MNYERRMQRVIDFIGQHLDDVLTLDQLSEVACFSKYHFHRQFSEYFGISLYQYVQMTRLRNAAYQLAYRQNHKVIDIALSVGFDSPEAFSRAF